MRASDRTSRPGRTSAPLRPAPRVRPCVKTAFTLMELTVVLTLVLLLAGATLPSIVKLFTAGSGAQAYNLFEAQTKSARAHAIGTGNYTGVHVQVGHFTEEEQIVCTNRSHTAIVEWRWDTEEEKRFFVIATGFMPHRMPGNMAFGELTDEFLDDDGYVPIHDATPPSLADFTTFTIAFAPSGSITRYVHGDDVKYELGFGGKFWSAPPDEPGVTAVTLFDYIQMAPRTADERKEYLNQTGAFIPINIHSGQFFQRD